MEDKNKEFIMIALVSGIYGLMIALFLIYSQFRILNMTAEALLDHIQNIETKLSFLPPYVLSKGNVQND